MNSIQALKEDNREYIRAIIEKAEKVCPGALSLVAVGGSFLTGDVHEKSDLDLLLLINGDRGWRIAKTFVRDDRGIGYDFYCTTWERLMAEAEYTHPHIAKFLEGEIVWCRAEADRERLAGLRGHCREILEAPFSSADLKKAETLFREAERLYGELMLAESLSESRVLAGDMVNASQNALMLLNKKYYRRGVRRAYEELQALEKRPADVCGLIGNIVLAEDKERGCRISELIFAGRRPFLRQKPAEIAMISAGFFAERILY